MFDRDESKLHVTPDSGNRKTGNIAVTTSGRETCPPTCPFMGKCYPNAGNLNLHWTKVSKGERGDTFPVFLGKLRALPPRKRVRGQQAGDMPGDGVHLDEAACVAYVQAATSRRKEFFTYTHYPLNDHNIRVLQRLNAMPRAGLSVSCETRKQVDYAMSLGLPAVIVLPSKTDKPGPTEAGTRIVECPAAITARLIKAGRLNESARITCANCGGSKGPLCARADRNFAVGFVAHGWTRIIDGILAALED